MNNTHELPVEYILTAIKGEKRVYYAIDQHSGGYPYWTDWFSTKATFSDLAQASNALRGTRKNDSYMSRDVFDIRIATVRTTIDTNISEEDIIEERKKQALAKLSKDERRLLGLEL